MDGVGEAKERVSCDFKKDSFDLKIVDFGGKSYRLVKTNLDKDIVPAESKVVVKKNSIKLVLRKAKGTYGSYDTWTDLVAKRKRSEEANKDPNAGLMDIMKQRAPHRAPRHNRSPRQARHPQPRRSPRAARRHLCPSPPIGRAVYEDGDDKMKKMIGETMEKSRRGES
eukprot:651991-Prymnesium_polylepis.1